MLGECANKIADILSNNKIIRPEDREIYVYGLDALISTMVNLAIIATLGIILGVFAETVVFMLAFSILRVYAGGYHAKSHMGCTAASVSIFAASMIIVIYTPEGLSGILSLVFALLSAAIIFLLAPIEHKNRPYEGDEYNKFKTTSRIIVFLETLAVVVGVACSLVDSRLIYSISLAMVNVVVILVLAKKVELRSE